MQETFQNEEKNNAEKKEKKIPNTLISFLEEYTKIYPAKNNLHQSVMS